MTAVLCNVMEHRYFFKPRVGKDYQEGFMGLRTLVLGAYHYCWYDKCRYFNECVSRGRALSGEQRFAKFIKLSRL